jgi:hypothetical protein
VEDTINALHRSTQAGALRDVADLNLCAQRSEESGFLGRSYERDDLVAAADQLFAQLAADETRRACDEVSRQRRYIMA